MRSRRTAAAVGVAMLLLGWGAARAQPVAEPEGYRAEPYRAPTPPTLAGARVVTTAEASASEPDRGVPDQDDEPVSRDIAAFDRSDG